MTRLLTRVSRLLRTRKDTPPAPALLNRDFISSYFLGGMGLEIGALHNPLPVSPSVTVRYVDRLSVEELRTHYPELAELPLVPLDIVDNGETLKSVADASQDFVIANHFLEHCEDPIGAVETFHRVLRPNGVLYLAIPEKTQTFDRDRPVTSLAHLVQDHEQGPAQSRMAHFREWATLVDKRTDDAEQHVTSLLQRNYSIHFHVWDQPRWLEFVAYLQQLMHWRLELVCQHGIELITVLRKKGA
ncbi:MAG TPA: methyltransferase domain-containing protein [Gemmatales bacterium]|nr:methyltransferase domain-containing protein [Gemmatales bacterium]